MVHVPAGEFLYGDSKETVYLDEFWIDKTLVTNADYKRFLDANPQHDIPCNDIDEAKPYCWDKQQRTYPKGKGAYPVVLVSWYDANAYAQWADLELPSEQQWEKAARGKNGLKYPWGKEWQENHSNTSEAGIGKTTEVGQFSPQGESHYNCMDMSGNVWEWTKSMYQEDVPWRVVRGGAWSKNKDHARTSFRSFGFASLRSCDYGFRVIARRQIISVQT
jgi:formylglycine-generating enzyme required for sulfatase activity